MLQQVIALGLITMGFINQFMALKNTNANVHIKHILYGQQKMNGCVLHPFVDEERIGLIVDNEEIYVTMNELCNASNTENKFYIKSNVMEIHINI